MSSSPPAPSVAVVVATGAVWFGSSAVLSTWANTAFLNHFQDPILHTLIRFFGSALFGWISYQFGDGITIDETAIVVHDVFWPATLLWIANCANSVALKAAVVTLTYVVKASIPVFTVMVCTLQGQKFDGMVYFSLIPICLGVALASGSDMYFSYLGLAAALVSALAQTFMNLSIKKVRSKKGHSGSKAFFGMTILCTLFTLPVTFGFSKLAGYGYSQFSPTSMDHLLSVYVEQQKGNFWPLILLVAGAVAYHVEYALNFVFVGFVSSVTFSVCDIARRIAIIVTGAIVFNKVLTQNNWVGIGIALSGVLWYSYLEGQIKQSSPSASPTAVESVYNADTTTPKKEKPKKPESVPRTKEKKASGKKMKPTVSASPAADVEAEAAPTPRRSKRLAGS